MIIDGKDHEISSGDFVGFPAQGPSHNFFNSGEEDLVYLIVGDRPPFDVCTYPGRDKRAYVYYEKNERKLEYVNDADVNK